MGDPGRRHRSPARRPGATQLYLRRLAAGEARNLPAPRRGQAQTTTAKDISRRNLILTHMGRCPPGPPTKGGAFGIHSFGLGEGGGCAGLAWAATITSAIADVIAQPRPTPRTPRPRPNQRAGSKGSPLAGVQRAAPSGGVQGQSPWPCFTRLPWVSGEWSVLHGR